MINNTQPDDELSRADELSEARSNIPDNTNGATSLTADRVAWGLWWGGAALVVLSWVDVVSNTLGWIGFAAAVASTFVSVMVRKYWRIPR